MAFLRHQTLLLLAAAALTLSTTAQAARVLQGFITVPATNPVSDASSCRWNNQAYSTGTWAYCPKCQDYSYCYCCNGAWTDCGNTQDWKVTCYNSLGHQRDWQDDRMIIVDRPTDFNWDPRSDHDDHHDHDEHHDDHTDHHDDHTDHHVDHNHDNNDQHHDDTTTMNNLPEVTPGVVITPATDNGDEFTHHHNDSDTFADRPWQTDDNMSDLSHRDMTVSSLDLDTHDIGSSHDSGNSDLGGHDFGGSSHGFGNGDLGSHDFASSDLGSHDLGSHDFGGSDFGSHDFGSSDIGGHDFGGHGRD